MGIRLFYGSDDMLLVITYDVNTTTPAGQKRLRKVAKCCEAHGQRVQNSVFECQVDEAQAVSLRATLEMLMDKESDSIRFYNLGNRYQSKVKHVGAKPGYDPKRPAFLYCSCCEADHKLSSPYHKPELNAQMVSA